MATIKVKRTLTSNPPAGLTFGELAFVQGITSFYVTNNVGTSVRIGAEVDTNTSLGTSDNKLPTQNAVKTYVDNAVSLSGTNQFNQIAVAGQNGLTADATSDILTFAAGSGITLTTNAGTDTITIANSGVLSLAGTPNEVEVSTSTGAITVGLPNDVTITNNLTVGGNLTINGTTTTVNSDVTTVDDPMMLLGTSGGVPITVTDGGKDRGIAFTYFDGSAGRTGFFGFDASASKFTFVPVATISGDIASGSAGEAQFKTLYLTTDGTNLGGLTLATLSTNRTYTLPDHTGTVVVPTNLGTSNYILKANGTTSQPTWIDPTAAGFTAYAATQLATTRTIQLSGDVTGSGTFNGSGDLNISTTIGSNTVALGTDTTGDYVAAVAVSGLGLSVSGSGENATYTITSGATSNNVVSQVVARDASGNFSAGTITASLSGNASTASTLQTARTISLGGDLSGSASFNGSSDITITATIASDSVALGTDTTGNYVATLTTSSSGLLINNSGTETAAVTVNLQKINTGIDFGTFAFTAGEFTNNGSGTVVLGVVDGGSY